MRQSPIGPSTPHVEDSVPLPVESMRNTRLPLFVVDYALQKALCPPNHSDRIEKVRKFEDVVPKKQSSPPLPSSTRLTRVFGRATTGLP
jgi:hypothetical protein